jgi:glycerol-3-phosphate acyltransferase PlsX
MIKIGVDAFGGDFAPEAAVKGAVLALDALGGDSRIVLFGDEATLCSLIESEGGSVEAFDIVHTTEVIEMGDHPVRAFQQKCNSSIVTGFRHLVEGRIDGFASAGSTGAMMVGAMQLVKVIDGVIRPTIAVRIGGKLLLDVGLNVDCKPDVLEQYAIIGSVYAKSLGVENPSVALLNIGAESTKGNLQAKAAYKLLQQGSELGRYRFVGNIEASHLFESESADVIVCDGFVGNTVLKLIEGLYSIYAETGAKSQIFDGLNYESTGGTPVLGVNAPVVIGHGKSTAEAIKNMILSTELTIRNKTVEHLKEAFR